EIDLYVEYTGNAGFFFNRSSDPAWKDLERGYALGAQLDYAANRIVWLTPARASNAWALAVRRDLAEANGLRTLSDFGRWVTAGGRVDRKSTRLNSSHLGISYAVFCLKKKNNRNTTLTTHLLKVVIDPRDAEAGVPFFLLPVPDDLSLTLAMPAITVDVHTIQRSSAAD